MTGEVRSRLIGVATIAAGLAFGWFFGLGPLREAQAGVAKVEYDVNIFILAPMLVVGGLALLIGGSAVGEAFSGPPQGRRQHIIVWSTFAVAIAAGFVAWRWLDGQLAALGYG